MTSQPSLASPRVCAWLLPLLYLLGAGALMGLSTNLAKVAAEAGVSAMAFMAWTTLPAGLALGAVQWLRGRRLALTARVLEYFLVSAAIGVVVPFLIFFAAAPRVGAGFVSLAIAFPPLYTYVLALGMGMERFQPLRALGVALALAGAGVLTLFKLSAPQAETGWVVAVLLAPVSLALGNIYRTRRWPPGASPADLAPGMLVACFLLVAAAALVLHASGLLDAGLFDVTVFDGRLLEGGPGHTAEAAAAAGRSPLLLIGVQALAFCGQYTLFFMLQKAGGPVYLSLLGSVVAVVGVTLAVALLGEPWPRGLTAGMVLIAGGILAMTVGGARARASAKEADEGPPQSPS